MQIKAAPARSGKGGFDFSTAIPHLHIGGKPRERERAAREALAGDRTVDSDTGRIERNHAVKLTPPCDQDGRACKTGIASLQMRFDPLIVADGSEIERPRQSVSGQIEPPRESPGPRLQPATRGEACIVESGDVDHRCTAPWKQDRAVPCKSAQRGLAVRAPRIARGIRIKQQADPSQSKRIGRAGQQDGELGPLDLPVECEFERAVPCLLAAAFKLKCPVASPHPVAGEGQGGREKLEAH